MPVVTDEGLADGSEDGGSSCSGSIDGDSVEDLSSCGGSSDGEGELSEGGGATQTPGQVEQKVAEAVAEVIGRPLPPQEPLMS
eukprot:scaffold301278_cov13-Tisochrysis_lutea.AAC.1